MNSHQKTPDASHRDEPRYDANGQYGSRPDDLPISQSFAATSHDTTDAAPSLPTITPNLMLNEPSRRDAMGRDEPRHDAIGRDNTSTLKRDSYADEPAVNWLDIEQTAAVLREQGISRTIRTIQRMCKRNVLVAKLVPTDNGVRYIINEQSIEEFVIRHVEKLPSGSIASEEMAPISEFNSASQPEPVSHASEAAGFEPNQSSDETRSHLREIIQIKDQQITMMQSQIDTANAQMAVKDEQIATMHERDHETNVLIQNLQNLVALPQAPTARDQPTQPINVDHRTG